MESVRLKNLHFEQLRLLCRVCGGRSKKFVEPSAKSCELVASELKSFYGMDITQDTTKYHSQTVCTKCYHRLVVLKNSAKPSVATVQKAKSEIDSTEYL